MFYSIYLLFISKVSYYSIVFFIKNKIRYTQIYYLNITWFIIKYKITSILFFKKRYFVLYHLLKDDRYYKNSDVDIIILCHKQKVLSLDPFFYFTRAF